MTMKKKKKKRKDQKKKIKIKNQHFVSENVSLDREAELRKSVLII